METIKLNARLSVEIEVNEELFKADPDNAIAEAILNRKAKLSGWDDYLPADWNNKFIEEDQSISIKDYDIMVHYN